MAKKKTKTLTYRWDRLDRYDTRVITVEDARDIVAVAGKRPSKQRVWVKMKAMGIGFIKTWKRHG